MKIDDDETMESFDVVSLFTAIPVQKTCQYLRTKLEQDDSLTLRTKLTTDDIISLSDFTLSNDLIYKQIHGCALGSPVSPVWLTFAWKSLKILQLKWPLQSQKHGNALLTIVFL